MRINLFEIYPESDGYQNWETAHFYKWMKNGESIIERSASRRVHNADGKWRLEKHRVWIACRDGQELEGFETRKLAKEHLTITR